LPIPNDIINTVRQLAATSKKAVGISFIESDCKRCLADDNYKAESIEEENT